MRVTATLAALVVCWNAGATAALCPAAPADLERLQATMAGGRFISYQPISLKVLGGKLTQANEASIRDDLEVLRPYFDGLITYGALNGAERIPDVAASLNFRAVIVGVQDPDNPTELANAFATWQRNPKLVVGFSLGNEIVLASDIALGKGRGWTRVGRSLAKVLTRAPRPALAVSEPFAQFLDDPDARKVFPHMDFMLVNIHPAFEPWFKSAGPFNWADFVVSVAGRLGAEVFCGPILVKETGVPTGPVELGYSEEKQRAFYRELEKQMKPSRSRAFSYFVAFDAPWQVDAPNPVPGPHPEEGFWGLFTVERVPKAVVREMTRLPDAGK
jgi:exo-beta-1,3-glucanase (GH17 family)